VRIALLSHNYLPHPGGVEIVVHNLGKRFAREHRVTLVTAAYGGRSGVSEEDGMEVHRLPALHVTKRAGVPYPVPLGKGVVLAARALADAEVLHAHGSLYATSLYASRLSRRRNIPLVVTEHVGFVEYPNPLLNGVQRAAWNLVGDRVIRNASVVAFFNERVASFLRSRYPGATLRCIPNGVDTDRFRPVTPEEQRAIRARLSLPLDAPIALFAGREAPKKNLAAVLSVPRDSFHLVVCGDVRGLRGERLTDLGLVPHGAMADVYRAADLFVHAASGEGFPLTVQEAMACGIPVVLLWDDGYAGSIDRDSVLACATLTDLGVAVQELALDPASRAELSRRGRTEVDRRWSWDATAAAYLESYRASGAGAKDRRTNP
jgi:D-inositol-3-phosphate glycosyltransferase